MDLSILEKLGLTKSEINVYWALLQLGESTTGPLIKKSNISAGKAYVLLDKLILKGLVSHYQTKGKKVFVAQSPSKLIDLVLELKQDLEVVDKQVQKLVTTLLIQQTVIKTSPMAEVFEGHQGFKTSSELTLKELKRGDTLYVLGPPKAVKRYEQYYNQWDEARIKKGVKLKIIYNYDNKEFGKTRIGMPLTQVRFMKHSMDTPSYINVYQDKVISINLLDIPVCFKITNAKIAMSQKSYFDFVWKNSSKS